jgi:hypothetical protein
MLGCSKRWVEADSGLGGDQVLQRIDEAREANALSSDGTQFDAIVETEGSYIYYTDGGGDSPMGPAQVAAGLLGFQFMGSEADDLKANDLETAVVIYVEDGQDASLLIQITPKGDSNSITRIFDSTGQPSYEGDEYTVTLGDNGTPVLRLSTYHTTENDLQGNIKFQVYEITESGDELWLGQFGAMVGFF